MEYQGKLNEYFHLDTIKSEDASWLNNFKGSCLRIFWNDSADTILIIDGVEYPLLQNQILFLSDMHDIVISKINEINLVRFNREFYSSEFFDKEIGCNGVLFFANAKIPIITLEGPHLTKFKLLWAVFLIEFETRDNLQSQMLLMLLKRFLILATRIYKIQNSNIHLHVTKLDTIREFNLLVEMHYKKKHSVLEYADLMNKPAKSLTNLFSLHSEKTPLKVIQNRIHIEAKRQLLFTQKIVKVIAFELGFEDLQSFSRFFKNKEGLSPKEFRYENRTTDKF
ncbi:transcriptional regulator, AraC family [Flavobacterium micromati]|uniref:Transcriptional regulator, AraC family n=1 Tax=Flavobacterium micromati TaxID=229205 RepID=A0A1M5N5Z5_9FLAO|nr:helix-turn-helix domain-containing protein [Flavobacterium micromati]SHG84569.1 transcriptional regulator, AraC family [Flavobacterium micromati]